MLNTAREVSKMIFTMDSNTDIGTVTIKAGLNIVTRVNSQYQVVHVSDIHQTYAILPDKYMHKLLKTVFFGMANGGFMHDEEDPEDLTAKVMPFKPRILKQA